MQTYDAVVLGAVEDMFCDFESEKQLEIWNEYCDKELSTWQSIDDVDYEKVYHNDQAFFSQIEMEKKGLSEAEIFKRVQRSKGNYNPFERYVTVVTVHNPKPKPNEYYYMTSAKAGALMCNDPDFANYLIDLYKQED